MSRRRGAWLRMAAILGVATIGVLAATGSASAHVVVEPTSAAKGDTVELVFAVPNERSTATTAVEVELPEGLTTVSPTAPAGWSVSISGRRIRWTGGEVAVGATTRFPVRIGPLPAADAVSFPTVQSYADGVDVRWIDPRGSSGASRPAPSMALTAAAAGGSTSTTTSTTAGGTAAGTTDHGTTRETAAGDGPAVTDATENTNRVTGWIGIALAIIGLAAALGWGAFAGRRAQERNRRLREARPEEAPAEEVQP